LNLDELSDEYKGFINKDKEEMLAYCKDITKPDADTPDTNWEYAQRAIYSALAVLSILGLTVVALSIFLNKKLSGHPSPLIARICIVEAVGCWSALIRYLRPKVFICYFQSYVLFGNATSVIWGKKPNYYESLLILIWSNEIINNFFQLVSLSLNLFLCIDLILTLQSPFEVARRRMTYYSVLSFVLPAAFTLQIWYNQDKLHFDPEHLVDPPHFEPTTGLVLAIGLSAYILVALYSIIFSLRRLYRPGMSIEIRKLFQRKHTIYVSLFIVIWTV